MLRDFSFVDLEFFLRFEQPTYIEPAWAGPMLRGAFGSQLRRLVCHDVGSSCWECPLRSTCAYEKIFCPHVPADADRLRKQRDLPRGFVLKPPLLGSKYGPERLFSFRMILVGELVQWLPHILVPFNELGRVGIGRTRTRYLLEKVVTRSADDGGGPELYRADDNLVRVNEMVKIGFEDFLRRAGSFEGDRVAVRFLTPTILRHNPGGRPGESRPQRVPEFHVLVKRLRDRVNRLATCYCNEELDLDFRDFGEHAEAVQTELVKGRWMERTRKTRQKKQQDFGGFIGEITYKGDLAPFLPLVLLGQYLHVGKNAVFGNGWYEVLCPEGRTIKAQRHQEKQP